MQNQRKKSLYIYRLFDYLAALASWVIFFIYRRYKEVGEEGLNDFYNDNNFYLGILVIPLFWLLVYHIFDKYRDIYRYSRLTTLINTMVISIFGSVIIMLTILIDDIVLDNLSILRSFLVLFLIHFTITSLIRMVLLTRANRQLKAGEVSYNTLIVGGDVRAERLYRDIISGPYRNAYNFIGFVDNAEKLNPPVSNSLSRLGNISDLSTIIENENIEEVIIAIETSEHNQLREILNILSKYNERLLVKIIPDMYDILLGTVKMNHVFGAILIEVDQELMPPWQWFIKRLMDVLGSVVFIILLIPLYIFTMIKVKLSSTGPIFYTQERIGKNGKPFNIIKFRSMYTNAEEMGPQLSSDNDPRITPWGRIMRKYRIDETPQFYNVLRGDMSLVGPRPERQFFIDQIVKQAPYYTHLLRVRPGITSWGQVKYGYASEVSEMIDRLKFDILYIENMSIALDIKILFYTLLILVKGKGK